MTRRTFVSIRNMVSQPMSMTICLFMSACSQSHAAQQQAVQQHATQSQPVAVASPLRVKHVAVVQSVKPTQTAAASARVAPLSSASQAPVVLVKPRAAESAATVAPIMPAAVSQAQAVVIRSPHAPPAIVRVKIPSLSVSSGQIVRATVYATSNTASVEARLYGYGMPLQRVGVGQFQLVYQVPAIPPYLKRPWPVQVIARNVDGLRASKQLMIDVHYVVNYQ